MRQRGERTLDEQALRQACDDRVLHQLFRRLAAGDAEVVGLRTTPAVAGEQEVDHPVNRRIVGNVRGREEMFRKRSAVTRPVLANNRPLLLPQ